MVFHEIIQERILLYTKDYQKDEEVTCLLGYYEGVFVMLQFECSNWFLLLYL